MHSMDSLDRQPRQRRTLATTQDKLKFNEMEAVIAKGRVSDFQAFLQSMDNLQRKSVLDSSSASDLTQKTLQEIAAERLALAEQNEQSVVTRARVQGLLLSMAAGGVGIYTAVKSIWPNDEDSSDETTSSDIQNAISGIITSGMLFYYSGKELFHVVKNTHARHQREKAVAIKEMLAKEQAIQPKLSNYYKDMLEKQRARDSERIENNAALIEEMASELHELKKLHKIHSPPVPRKKKSNGKKRKKAQISVEELEASDDESSSYSDMPPETPSPDSSLE